MLSLYEIAPRSWGCELPGKVSSVKFVSFVTELIIFPEDNELSKS